MKLGDVAEKEIDCFSRKIREFGCCRKTSIECSYGNCMKFAGDVAEKNERKKMHQLIRILHYSNSYFLGA